LTLYTNLTSNFSAAKRGNVKKSGSGEGQFLKRQSNWGKGRGIGSFGYLQLKIMDLKC